MTHRNDPLVATIDVPLPGDCAPLRVKITFDSVGGVEALSLGLIPPNSPDGRRPLDALHLTGESLPYLRRALDALEALVGRMAFLAPYRCNRCAAPIALSDQTRRPPCAVCGYDDEPGDL